MAIANPTNITGISNWVGYLNSVTSQFFAVLFFMLTPFLIILMFMKVELKIRWLIASFTTVVIGTLLRAQGLIGNQIFAIPVTFLVFGLLWVIFEKNN